MIVSPYLGDKWEWDDNATAIKLARAIEALRDYPDGHVHFAIGYSIRHDLARLRRCVAVAVEGWFDNSAFARRCTCYVLPHADDCGLLIGIRKSGERVYAEEGTA